MSTSEWISGIGSLVGGFSSASSARRAAADQRAWSEMMDNTKHQRNVSDLRAAGLNPMLAAMSGSGGGGYGAGAVSGGENIVGDALDRAHSARQLSLQRKQVEGQIDIGNRNADITERQVDSNIDVAKQNLGIAFDRLKLDTASSAANVALLEANFKKVLNDIKNSDILTLAQAGMLYAQTGMYDEQRNLARANSAFTYARTKHQGLETELRGYDRNRQKHWEYLYGNPVWRITHGLRTAFFGSGNPLNIGP